MLKIKYYLLLSCLMVGLSGCSNEIKKSDDLNKETLLTTKETPYETGVVTLGDFTKEIFCSGKPFYPNKQNLSFEVDGAEVIFDKFLVETDQEVTKGTPIASFQIIYDKVALAEKELKLTRAKEAFSSTLLQKETELLNAEKNLQSIPSGFDKDINTIKYKKQKMDYENYKISTAKSLTNEEKELQEYKDSLTKTELLAPIDGVIDELLNIKEGTTIYPDWVLGTMYTKDQILIEAVDDSGYLKYNMDVTVEFKGLDEETILNGKVISSPNILSNGANLETAYIELKDIPKDLLWGGKITVHAKPVSMENVLLVEASAVSFGEQGPYVYLLENGSLHKRNFTPGGNNANYYWIVQGLEEGQTIVTKY
jgi:multidrug efflux pump subunit AcrA (membrane-fusion protein)